MIANWFGRARGANRAADETGAAAEREVITPREHPGVVHADVTLLDADTREMYRDAQEAQEELASDPPVVREFTFRRPFQLGFIVTLGAIAAIVFGGAVGQLSSIIMYTVGALFVALGLDPIVRMLKRKGLSRPLGIAVVFGGFTLLIALILSLVIPVITEQVSLFIRSAPGYLNEVAHQPWFFELSERLGQAVDLEGLIDQARNFAGNPQNWAIMAGGIWEAGIGVANGITAGIIVLILSLYFLSSLDTIKRGFYSLVPRSSRVSVIDITEQVTKSVGGYVNGMVILALINATLGFIAMTIFGVPFASLLAVLVFLLALIPLIGSVLATVLVTAIALFNSPATALGIGIYYLIYMQLESYLLTPRVMNKVVSVPGSLVVIGALAGGTLLGLLGALISIPVTAMVLMIVKQVWVPRQELR